MERRLLRSHAQKMVAGVCGGLAFYFNIDPTLVRLIFVLLTLAGSGLGVLLYIVLWVITPYDDGEIVPAGEDLANGVRRMADEARGAYRTASPTVMLVIGISLITLGGVYLMQNLGFMWFRWFHLGALWPLLIVAAGVALLVRGQKVEKHDAE
jgi:phage shock protein C